MQSDSDSNAAQQNGTSINYNNDEPLDSSIPQFPYALEARQAIHRSQEFFFSQQHEDGHWRAELEGDALLQGETVLLLTFLGLENEPLAAKLANKLVLTQSETGGWPMFTGGADSLTNTVKAYFALKITGHPLNAPYMQKARDAVMRMGGADRVNSFTRFYLALLGQISYQQCPAVPPEMIFLPKWFPINLYAVSSWTRTIIVPLSIVSALRPVRQLPVEMGIRELFVNAPEQWPPLSAPKVTKPGEKPRQPGFFSWERFFRTTDVLLKKYQNWFGSNFLRKRAIKKMESWLWEHCQNSDGPGAIQPPIVWGLVAMKALGYSDDSEQVTYFLNELHKLIIEDGIDSNGKESAHSQPCQSPVWDTLLTLRALAAGGVRLEGDAPYNLKARKAMEWLLAQQHTKKGDWAVTNPNLEPGGWAFEYHNDFYPDCDDSAMAIMAIHELCGKERLAVSSQQLEELLAVSSQQLEEQSENIACELTANRSPLTATKNRLSAAISRCVTWLEGMQNKDGGWASFDKNNTREFLCHVPFADHNAMIDPSTTDITGRVLEAFGSLGRRTGEKIIDRAVAFMLKEQLPDGSWFGRWGTNYIYGTGEALNGLGAVGVSPSDPAVAAGVNWLKAHQQPNGGWGETVESYQNPLLKGTGKTTASQTAWALLGLIASGEAASEAVCRGIRYLLDNQSRDGQWEEPEFTGTGFPLVFYLRYHWYRNYFPLKALSDWTTKLSQAQCNALLANIEDSSDTIQNRSADAKGKKCKSNSCSSDQADELRKIVQARAENMQCALRIVREELLNPEEEILSPQFNEQNIGTPRFHLVSTGTD